MQASCVVEFPGGAVECPAGAALHSRGRQLNGEQRDVERMHPDLCAQDRPRLCCMTHLYVYHAHVSMHILAYLHA